MDEKTKVPKSAIGKFLMKSRTIEYAVEFVMAVNETTDEDLELMLLTHSAVILGTPAEFAVEDDPTHFSADLSTCWEYRRKTLLQLEEEEGEQTLLEESGLIYLKNVTVFQLSTPKVRTKLEQLIVFVDQIVGFSVSNPAENRIVLEKDSLQCDK